MNIWWQPSVGYSKLAHHLEPLPWDGSWIFCVWFGLKVRFTCHIIPWTDRRDFFHVDTQYLGKYYFILWSLLPGDMSITFKKKTATTTLNKHTRLAGCTLIVSVLLRWFLHWKVNTHYKQHDIVWEKMQRIFKAFCPCPNEKVFTNRYRDAENF